MSPVVIKPYEEMDLKIYAYTLPEVPSHDGYVKIGSTTRKVEKRVFEQIGTAGLNPNILFQKTARKSDGTWFNDRELHRFLKQNGIPQKDFNGYADEWFYFNGVLEKAERLTDKFINSDYDGIHITEHTSDYVLRDEQRRAVEVTLEYYGKGQEPREFLWNAKPRFGKTLTAYDFVRKIGATNVLIVTNRPAIANSWFDDFQKFIAWQEPNKRFISETDALKDKAMSREEFLRELERQNLDEISQITFISLQDLKGARFAGGDYDKLQWVEDLAWDLLIIDEAHEGVDTEKTDVAFDKISREFTLHLSGTPFKALANNKFNDDQIFNWSYVDEQEAKLNWDHTMGTNPYENLPKLSLFTYQMSKMIEDRLEKGLTLEDEIDVDFAFDLNEFLRVKNNGRFEYEVSVKKFLDNLTSGEFPFASGQHRDELDHTFWLLPRVNSAKALELLLKEHPVFGEYYIILAAGDGVSADADLTLKEATDFKRNEKSFNRVRKAIAENEKTITLSVGQLTTGVTIPEWSAVLMLNNIKSPSLYFQAAFRAQNPYEFTRGDKRYRKENAYIFDFAPERTLLLFDEFANNLTSGAPRTTEDRKNRIKELLNFFPVIGEDEEGNMHELDATEVLTIPARITSQEVVRRGFMSNLLFANIAGIFSGHTRFKEILDKIPPEKNKRLTERREVVVTDPMLDEEGNVRISAGIVINQTKDLFGPAIYKVIESAKFLDPQESVITNDIKDLVEGGFGKFKKTFGLSKTRTDKVKAEVVVEVENVVKKNLDTYMDHIAEVSSQFSSKIQSAEAVEDEVRVARLKEEHEQKKAEIAEVFASQVNEEVSTLIETAVEKQIERGEEEKKRTTEEDVRDHLRGFTRTIPAFLMAYGDEHTTLGTFEEDIDEATFEELTSITVDEFKMLRDGFDYIDDDGNNRKVPGLFNEMVFDASIKEFFATKDRLSDYFNDRLTEDIFDYIPPQRTNQIFTPRRVVKMMVDMIEESQPDIFTDYNAKFLDPYSKSGLYITEIVKRLYEGLSEQIPSSQKRIKWILENQVYALAPSNIIYNIVINYVFSKFDGISTKNIVEFNSAEDVNDDNWKKKVFEAFGGEDLKFDVIIGNPPYQEMDGGAQASASPLYHRFVELAQELDPELISFIIPARWFSGGKGLDSFREEMLNDKRIRELHDYFDATDCFPGIDISGGVCYFLWDKDHHGECKVTSYRGGKINSMIRPLSLKGNDTLIRFNEAISILNKVHCKDFNSFADGISARKPFGLPTNVTVKKTRDTDDVIIYAYPSNGFFPSRKIERNANLVDQWKVLSAKAYGERGDFPYRVIAKPFIAEPGSCCSETYIVIRACESRKKAQNVIAYMGTRFFRFLVLLKKNTQDATSKVYSLVPIQDFSQSWTDEQLYSKYGLTEEEIDFIESMVRPMELDGDR